MSTLLSQLVWVYCATTLLFCGRQPRFFAIVFALVLLVVCPLFCSIVLLIVPGIFMKTCSVYYVHYTSISVVLSVAKYCKVSISCLPYIGLRTINRETRVRLQTLIIKKKK